MEKISKAFAVRTGLEPATPGVTGRYSNQLNYRTNVQTLCVFVERGCKGTQIFVTCKFFFHFLLKKRQKSDGGPFVKSAVGCVQNQKTMKFSAFHCACVI